LKGSGLLRLGIQTVFSRNDGHGLVAVGWPDGHYATNICTSFPGFLCCHRFVDLQLVRYMNFFLMDDLEASKFHVPSKMYADRWQVMISFVPNERTYEIKSKQQHHCCIVLGMTEWSRHALVEIDFDDSERRNPRTWKYEFYLSARGTERDELQYMPRRTSTAITSLVVDRSFFCLIIDLSSFGFHTN
jgi:hypothetical protein